MESSFQHDADEQMAEILCTLQTKQFAPLTLLSSAKGESYLD